MADAERTGLDALRRLAHRGGCEGSAGGGLSGTARVVDILRPLAAALGLPTPAGNPQMLPSAPDAAVALGAAPLGKGAVEAFRAKGGPSTPGSDSPALQSSRTPVPVPHAAITTADRSGGGFPGDQWPILILLPLGLVLLAFAVLRRNARLETSAPGGRAGALELRAAPAPVLPPTAPPPPVEKADRAASAPPAPAVRPPAVPPPPPAPPSTRPAPPKPSIAPAPQVVRRRPRQPAFLAGDSLLAAIVRRRARRRGRPR